METNYHLKYRNQDQQQYYKEQNNQSQQQQQQTNQQQGQYQHQQQQQQEQQYYQNKEEYQQQQQNSQPSSLTQSNFQILDQSHQQSKIEKQYYSSTLNNKNFKNHPKYGNMLIFYQFKNKNWFISLGPNYLFFFFAYLSFTIATIYLVGLVNQEIENNYFKMINFCFCWGQNLSYLLVALSNPGIVFKEQRKNKNINQLKNKNENENKQRICSICQAPQNRKTYHCRECDICIQNYDHHCPWTSKCIGGGNLKRFYLFVILTPIYIFYYMIVFMICMANVTMQHNKNLKSHTINNTNINGIHRIGKLF